MNNLKVVLLVLFVNLSVYSQSYDQYLSGHWSFDDPLNLFDSEIGNPIIPVGDYIKSIRGSDYFDGAVNVIYTNYLNIDHGINPNGGGALVNEYTIVMDIMVTRLQKTYALLQTDTSNLTNADIFIINNGQIGSESLGYSPDSLMTKSLWHRVAISVKAGSFIKFYINGNNVYEGEGPDVDGALSLKENVLLFADDNREDNIINCSDIKMYSKALGDIEISDLGGFSDIDDKYLTTYLQTPTPNSIYICWHSEKVGSKLNYGLSEDITNEETPEFLELESGLIWNWVKLDNLTPSTGYYYKVTTDSIDGLGQESKLNRFITQPTPEDNSKFIFVVEADNQNNGDIHEVITKSIIETLGKKYGDQFEDSVRLIINAGDITQDGDQLFKYRKEYFNPIGELSRKIPYMVAAGNHEYEHEYYYSHMKYEDIGGPEGEKYYSFQSGKVLFFMLNSNTMGNQQVAWLSEELQKAESNDSIEFIFVFVHHYIDSETGLNKGIAREWVRDEVMTRMIRKSSKVVMLGTGHNHSYSRGAYEDANFWYTITACAGGSLDRWKGRDLETVDKENIFKTFDHYGYNIIEVDPKSKKVKFYKYSIGHPDRVIKNELYDEFQLTLGDSSSPNTPLSIYPSSSLTVDVPFDFVASSYLDEQYDSLSSQYQIFNISSNQELLVCDSLINYVNYFRDSGYPFYEPVNQFAGGKLSTLSIDSTYFSVGEQYKWRIRYRNQNLNWSEWSDFSTFTIGEITDIKITEDLINEYSLQQNYPNPFNPSTIINFEIPNIGQTSENKVLLKVFDILGREVKTLVDDFKSPGKYSVAFNSEGLVSGLYFYRLQHGETTLLKKMIVLK